MKRVLLTGALGFTGQSLSRLLKARGYFVHGLGAHQPSQLPETLDAYSCADIRDLVAVRDVLQSVCPHAVVHLAAISFVGHGDASEIYTTNVIATRHLLQAISECEVALEAIILASSANVYGNSLEGILDEETPFRPVNDYAVSKVAMEYVARLYAERLPIIVTRPFNYTGRGQSANFLIPKIVDHARKRAEIIELGNVDVARDFSDVRMVAESYVRLLETPAAIGRTINICSGRSFTLREMLEKVERISGHHMDIQINPAFVRANEVRQMRGDVTLLHDLVGPIENPPIDETLTWMLED